MPRPVILSAQRFDERLRSCPAFGCRTPCRGAPDKAAAEHTRLPRGRIVEHAGLARRYALLARHQFDFIVAVDRTKPCRLRRTGRSHPHEHLQLIADSAVERPAPD